MGLKIYQVDAFTTTPFTGNPAGVCILEQPAQDSWMQSMALEMNLSETAFLYREGDAFRLRWFTPASEVALCGHATLSSAHILWETGILSLTDEARFNTLSGRLTAKRLSDRIELDFPATPPAPVAEPDGLLDALGVEPVYVGKSRFDLIVEVATAEIVKALNPDIGALKKLDARGFMVTGKSNDPDIDFVSRFFAPAVGVDEDPVTGSAHCCLGSYWSKKLGKTELNAWQASARGGRMTVRVEGDRVVLGGRAVTVFTAELSEPAAPEAVC